MRYPFALPILVAILPWTALADPGTDPPLRPAPSPMAMPPSDLETNGNAIQPQQLAEILMLRSQRGSVLAGTLLDGRGDQPGDSDRDESHFGKLLSDVARQRKPRILSPREASHRTMAVDAPSSGIRTNSVAADHDVRLAELLRRAGRALDRHAGRHERQARHDDAARLRLLADQLRTEANMVSRTTPAGTPRFKTSDTGSSDHDEP